MPRRARALKRATPPDGKYSSVMVAELINKIMESGKKRTAESIVYGALELLEKQTQKDAVAALEQALKNATPLLEVKPRRVGGATYQVPVEVEAARGVSLARRWIIAAAKAKKGKAMKDKLASELIDAYQGQGSTIKKREDTHKMAEANRAFAHYRW
jgi:small subunit ribosomal protein S7